jgi:hypothetical protein
MPTNSFIVSELEEPNLLTCPRNGMTKTDNEKETMPMITSCKKCRNLSLGLVTKARACKGANQEGM